MELMKIKEWVDVWKKENSKSLSFIWAILPDWETVYILYTAAIRVGNDF